MFIQAGLAVDPPTARHLVGGAGHKKADLTHQLVWWCVHKLAVIPSSQGNIGSHLNIPTQGSECTSILLPLHDLTNYCSHIQCRLER